MKNNDNLICDDMLGRLARYLRLVGFDTLYFRDISDESLISQAKIDKRIIITRDTLLIKRKWVRENSILITENNYKSQLKELFAVLPCKNIKMFSRCSLCNSELFNISKKEVLHLVPSYVFQTQSQFKFCPKCKKIYWNATHIQHIREVFRSAGIF